MACGKTFPFAEGIKCFNKEKCMADKEEKQVPLSLVEAFRGANEALVESLVVAQERNLKYAQSVFESTIEVLRNQVAGMRSLIEQQAKKQQEALQKLTPGSVASSAPDTYLGLFSTPLAYFQQILDLLESVSEQNLESFQKATESFEQVAQQGFKQWQEAAEQTQRAIPKPGE